MAGHLPSSIDEVVEDLYPRIIDLIKTDDFALFGHSMGALVAYEMARKFVRARRKRPLHLFVTGADGPSSLERTKQRKYLLDQDAFVAELIKYGGCPPSLLEDSEVLDRFLPVLRSDFKAAETYRHVTSEPIPVPLTVITGTEENLKHSEIMLWKNESTFPVDFRLMTGNHFFINSHVDEILDVIQFKCSVNGGSLPNFSVN